MPWIDVEELKDHLNKTSDADDAELDGFIDAACAMVEDLKGHVDLVTVTEILAADSTYSNTGARLYGYWDNIVTLSETPIAAITSVTQLAGDGSETAVAQQNLATGVDLGWRLVENVLHVPFRTPRFSSYRIVYQAGLAEVPGNYRIAALELAAHLWRSTQLNASQGIPGQGDADPEFIRGMSYALPFRVRELLGIYGSSIGAAGGVVIA